MGYTTEFIRAVHYTKGRERPVTRIVLHWMATTLAGCDATFSGGGRQASAHYGLEGSKRHQYVLLGDTAWHAGDRTINHESIGIEHSAQPGRDASEETIQNSIDLCTELCRKYGLGADAIDKHNDFYATQCPGTLPVDRIREAVRLRLRGEEPGLAAEDVNKVNDYTRALLLDGYTAGGVDKPSILDILVENQRRITALSKALQPSVLAAAVKAALPADAGQVDVDELARKVVLELGKE
jgi:N-acetyl-anhydromuramyl-L-alanine amidase AmpD